MHHKKKIKIARSTEDSGYSVMTAQDVARKHGLAHSTLTKKHKEKKEHHKDGEHKMKSLKKKVKKHVELPLSRKKGTEKAYSKKSMQQIRTKVKSHRVAQKHLDM